MLGLVENEICT